MFARVTNFKMKAEDLDDATALVNSLRDQILGLPGLHQFINVINQDGRGYILSFYDSEAVANANPGKVAEIWLAFASHLEVPPSAAGFDVVANWSN